MTSKRTAPIEPDLQPWCIQDEAQPGDIFLRCRCSSLNPLRILDASPGRIAEAITQAESWDGQEWMPQNADYPQTLPSLKLIGYQVAYAKTFDNQDARLMVFCFRKLQK